MAKLGKIQHNLKRFKMVNRFRAKREELRKRSLDPSLSIEERMVARQKLASMPRNSSDTRIRNRCNLTGRPRGFLRKFGLSRIKFRELAHEGEISGVRKASW